MLGLIAGHGLLPRVIYNTLNPTCVIGLDDGFDDYDYFKNSNFIKVKFGEVGKILDFLKTNKVNQVVCGGYVKKPSFSNLKVDFRGLLLLWRILKLQNRGDDGILRSVEGFLNQNGFELKSIKDLLPDLLISYGVLNDIKPTKHQQNDIKLGQNVLNTISCLDIGQALVVQEGFILGIEAAEGTSELIKRCSNYAYKSKTRPILVKTTKRNQTLKLDLPTIGSETIDLLAKYGYAGVAIEAGSTLILEKDQVIRDANALNLWIVGI